jgi:hypothetical protein
MLGRGWWLHDIDQFYQAQEQSGTCCIDLVPQELDAMVASLCLIGFLSLLTARPFGRVVALVTQLVAAAFCGMTLWSAFQGSLRAQYMFPDRFPEPSVWLAFPAPAFPSEWRIVLYGIWSLLFAGFLVRHISASTGAHRVTPN